MVLCQTGTNDLDDHHVRKNCTCMHTVHARGLKTMQSMFVPAAHYSLAPRARVCVCVCVCVCLDLRVLHGADRCAGLLPA
jgi:hypothetical protein